jgi:hypothetical protein
VQKLGWLFVASLCASILVSAAETSNRFSALIAFWPRYFWVLPFSVTISSVSLLIANLILGPVAVGVPRKLLSGAYLTNGPSLALLSVSTSLGVPTPTLVAYVTPAIVLASAWAFYRSLGPADEDGISISEEHQQIEYETWVKSIGEQATGGVQSLE